MIPSEIEIKHLAKRAIIYMARIGSKFSNPIIFTIIYWDQLIRVICSSMNILIPFSMRRDVYSSFYVQVLIC